METFVIRVWVPWDDDRRVVDTSQLRGWMRHVGTGTEVAFTEDRALLALLHAAVAPRAGVATTPRLEGGPKAT